MPQDDNEAERFRQGLANLQEAYQRLSVLVSNFDT